MKGDGAQLMVMAAVMMAIGMTAVALATYSSMSSVGASVQTGTDDSETAFRDLEKTYRQAVLRAYGTDRDSPGPPLDSLRGNLTRWGERHGYSVVMLPRNASKGFIDIDGDGSLDTFNGSIETSDGTTQFSDDVKVELP